MFSILTAYRRPPGSSIRVRKGLDLPITGQPDQVVYPARAVNSVAVCPADLAGLRVKALVKEGERIRTGDPLLCDRKHPEILITSPGSGVVSSIELGPRRSIQSIIVELHGDASTDFPAYPNEDLSQLSPDVIRSLLLDSGLWTSFRARPFGCIPSPESQPEAIFVRAIDTNPLAADPEIVVTPKADAFRDGLQLLSRLTQGPVYLCQGGRTAAFSKDVERLRVVRFQGPHPAGLVGTHIHFLHRVGLHRVVWYLDYQDTIAMGECCRTGKLPIRRIVALGGAMLRHPRLVETRVGCNLGDLLEGGLRDSACRIITGSILSGRTASGMQGFLGRYDSQVSVIPEAPANFQEVRIPRRARNFSVHTLLPHRKSSYCFSTAAGHQTTLFPLDTFDRVMPLDVMPGPLLRALAVGDLEQSVSLGCLELEEEDLALCTFLCPGRLEYGKLLRSVLNRLEREV